MGAPVTTVRLDPVGIRLDDGFSTKIAFAIDPDVSFWEKTVQPPGMDGGDPVETTTMHNKKYRSMSSRQLITLTEIQTTVAWNPVLYDQIQALINQEGSVTIMFSDTSTLDFFGYLQKFEPQDFKEGDQPEAQITIQPTNIDPLDGSEADPVFTAAP